MFRLFVAIVFFTASGSSVYAGLLDKGYSAHYELYKGFFHFGDTYRVYTVDNKGNFAFESETKPLQSLSWLLDGYILERSSGRVSKKGWRVDKYLFQKVHGKRKWIEDMSFDWREGQVKVKTEKQQWSFAIPADAKDKLIYQVTVMDELSKGHRDFIYHIAAKRKLETWDIGVVGEERLETPLGTYDTIKVTRKNDKRRTVLWCAKSLDYLPVKIEYTETDGSSFTAKLIALDAKRGN